MRRSEILRQCRGLLTTPFQVLRFCSKQWEWAECISGIRLCGYF